MVTICLNMIVKNESKIITRLFDSVIDIIDTYVICDTGSTDDTIHVINSYFNNRNISGKIIEEPFINFEHNRNVALQHAKNSADYILLLDADMKFVITPKFNKEQLDKDIYLIQQITPSLKYYNLRLFKSKLDIKCKGVTHEYYNILDKNTTRENLNSIYINDIGDGGSKQNKYTRDIKLLQEGIKQEPNNVRYFFYLAQSYFCVQDFINAKKWYLKRIESGGWHEETWYSYLQLGETYMRLNQPDMAIISWLNGYDYYPKRSENLYKIIRHYRIHQKNNLAYSFYKIAKNIKYPHDDLLFVDYKIYNYLLEYEYLIFGSYLEEVKEYEDMTKKIVYLLNKDIPFYLSQIILKGTKFYDNSIENSILETYDFSTSLEFNNQRLNSSTPSILKLKNTYVMNLRFVNYRIDSKGNYVFIHNNLPTTSENEKLLTVNKYITLNHNLEIKDEHIISSQFDNKLRYHAYEDVRIFLENDEISFTCTGQNPKNMQINVGYGKYDKKNISSTYLLSPFKRSCEKNWCAFRHDNKSKYVYEWAPLQIGEIIDDKFIIQQTIQSPMYFKYIKGSTPGFVYKGEIFFMGHLIVYHENLPREYYHCLIVLDEKTLQIKKYSKPFYFSKNYNETVEYCLGLIVEKNRIICSYSIMDAQSYVSIYDKKKLFQQIF
jgi:hypothetical protein